MRLSPARRNALFAVLAFVSILFAMGGLEGWMEQRDARRQLVYVIPPGTSARLQAGEKIDVLPATIRLALDAQDTLVIRNDDSEPVTVGVFRLEAGQQLQQKFTQPGTYKLICSAHSSGELQIVVERTASKP